MEKIFTPRTHLPSDPVKRLESVVAVCISTGYVNRDVLAHYYSLSPLQASILLREFLQAHVNDVRRDTKCNGYVLLGYPQKHDKNKHSKPH